MNHLYGCNFLENKWIFIIFFAHERYAFPCSFFSLMQHCKHTPSHVELHLNVTGMG